MIDDTQELELLMRLIKRYPEDFKFLMNLFEDVKNPKFKDHYLWWNEVDRDETRNR